MWTQSSSLDNLYSSTRSLLGVDPPLEPSIEDECCEACPKLTYRQRLVGFAVCFGLGILVELGSFFRLVELIEGNPRPFAVCYSLGNIIAICSSFFLAGPWNQAKKMFAQTRIVATVTYLTAIIATLFCAYYDGDLPGRAAIIVFLIVVQMLALLWYMLSFIPYARDVVTDILKRMCCDC